MKKAKKSKSTLPKLSKAILAGIEKYPKQAYNIWITAEKDEACAIGGALAVYGLYLSAILSGTWREAIDKFQEEYGISIYDCNDEGMSREDIAGMLIVIGY